MMSKSTQKRPVKKKAVKNVAKKPPVKKGAQASVAKKGENGLNSNLKLLTYALNNSSDAVFWMGPDAKFVYVNKKACKALGYTKKELLGMTVHDIDPLFQKKVWPSHWKEISEKKVMTIETIHRRKSGETFPVEILINYHVFEGQEFMFSFARDISERKKADKALLESEASFRELAEVSFEAIVIHDNGRLINVNKRFCDMYGYTRKELFDKNMIKLMVAPHEYKKVNKRVTNGNAEFYETVHIHKDGTEFPVEVRVREMEYEGEKVRVAAVLDVTDRELAEESLRESELKFRNIVESSPIGMYMYQLMDDDRLVLVGSNPAADRLVSDDNSRKLGLTIEEAFPPLAGTEVAKMYKEVARTGKPWHAEQVDYEDEKIAGAFEVHAFQTSPNMMVAAFLNITKRKESAAALERLAAAVDSAAESIVITDAQGNVIYVNPWFETMTGYGADEVLGQNTRILQSGKHDNKFYAELWETILSGKTWRGRFINKKKDGSLFEEEAVISPVSDDDGKIINFVAVKRDITQEVILEKQVMQSQKMAAIGQLAHKVAHHFTNILVMILGNAQLAKEYLPAGSEAAQHIDEVVRAANRVSTLTAELLAFAHPAELTLKVRRLNKALLGVEDLLKETVSSNVELVMDLENADIKVNIDSVKMEQAIVHLAINADEAMGKTGGKLTISAGLSDFGEGFAMITVADTGEGLLGEMKQQIFDPFFSTKNTTKNPGLGLATVYGIVIQHGGFISVDSKPGEGTTFKIYLSMAE